jgi:LuxR family maltose regulon positive regulatory protein
MSSKERTPLDCAPVAGIDLERPSLGDLVERPRLVERLRGGAGPLVLLSAPSGYGKSVLLAQWAAADPRPFASITLGDVHNDPVLLLGWIVEALERTEPLPGEVAAALAGPEPDIRGVVLPRLARALAMRESASVLVLDELEHVDSPLSLLAIRTLAEHARPGTQIAVATRSEPALPLGRLRVNRLLTELGRGDLAMTTPEARSLLLGAGVELDAERLELLVRRAEGWPAALYLAALALCEHPGDESTIAHFAGDDRALAEYVRDEFLAPVSRHHREFLRRAAVLDRFSADLCDAVLGRRDSAAVLRELAQGNMLLHSLDRKSEWFRFHALLAETLRAELRRTEPELEPELHLRASKWWAAQGDMDRAIGHAVEAEAYERAGILLWQGVPEYNARGRIATVTRWLERLGPERVAEYPTLSLTAAQVCLTRGEGSMTDHWIAVSHSLIEELSDSPHKHMLQAGLAAAEAGLCRNGVASMTRLALAAAELAPPEHPGISMCHLLAGTGLRLGGRREEARQQLGVGVRRAAVGAPHVQVLCLTQLALIAVEDDDWHLAEALAARTRAQIERSGLGDYTTAALAFAISAFVRSRRGAEPEAVADLRQGLLLMRRLEDFAIPYEAQTRIALARAAIALDRRELACELLAEARVLVRREPEAPALAGWLAEAEAEAAAISAASGVRELTPAELRLLHQLPTHHSLPQIAAEFHVSPNTVKSQARAVYAKLGVSSRREAVERARAAGLLPAPD